MAKGLTRTRGDSSLREEREGGPRAKKWVWPEESEKEKPDAMRSSRREKKAGHLRYGHGDILEGREQKTEGDKSRKGV